MKRARLARRTRINPVSKGRQIRLRRLADAALVAIRRANGRCEVCRMVETISKPLENHHIVKRSQSLVLYAEPDNLARLCRECHDRTDWPFDRGRLQILGWVDGVLAWMIVKAPSKWAVRASSNS